MSGIVLMLVMVQKLDSNCADYAILILLYVQIFKRNSPFNSLLKNCSGENFCPGNFNKISTLLSMSFIM